MGTAITVTCLAFAVSAAPALAQSQPCANPNALGLARFYLNKLAGRYAIIEYK